MRGKAGFAYNIDAINRITPAYAGKRLLERPPTTATRDHPRLCGEKKNACFRHFLTVGSPPPMRGKVESVNFVCNRNRITPAYAGKRSKNRTS